MKRRISHRARGESQAVLFMDCSGRCRRMVPRRIDGGGERRGRKEVKMCSEYSPNMDTRLSCAGEGLGRGKNDRHKFKPDKIVQAKGGGGGGRRDQEGA